MLLRDVKQVLSDRTTMTLAVLTALLAISFALQAGWPAAGRALLVGGLLIASRATYLLLTRVNVVISSLFNLALLIIVWFWFVGAAHLITDVLTLLFGVGVALLAFMIHDMMSSSRPVRTESGAAAAPPYEEDPFNPGDLSETFAAFNEMSWFDKLLLFGTVRHYYAFLAAVLTTAWLSFSAIDAIRSAHFQQQLAQSIRPPAVADSSVPRLGLALSGGGYRAALVHAGVLSALDELAQRRDSSFRIDVISTVSGGSIIGAFYATGHRPAEFRDLMLERAFNLKRSLLHAGNLIHLLATSHVVGTDHTLLPIEDFTWLDVQARQLDALFLRGVTFGDTSLMRRDSPELMLGTTDLVGEEMLGVTSRGLVIEPIASSMRRTTFAEPPNRQFPSGPGSTYRATTDREFPGGAKLSRLVAASGAFPGAFPPLLVEPQSRRSVEQGSSPNDTLRLLLADGGIGDNLGLSLLRAAARLASDTNDLKRWKVDLVIASDASAYPGTRVPTSALGRVGRAIDVVYLATGGDNPLLARSSAPPPAPTLLLSPRDFTSRLPDAHATLGDATQLPFGTESALPTVARDGCGNPPPSATWRVNGFPRDVLEAIVRDMPAADRDSATSALAELTRAGTIADTGWKTTNATPTAAESVLARMVRREIERKTRTFGATSTLDDQLSRKTVEDLYTLGRYLVLLNRPYIDYWLTRARRHCA